MKFIPFAIAATLMLAASAQANEAVIRKALLQQFPKAQISSIKQTPYSGLFEVYLDGQLLYSDAKAQYLFAGDVIDFENRRNLTQARLNQLQAVNWDTLPLKNALKTVKGDGARKLVVFSDVDCPYCRKLEAELTRIDNITVYTFLYPIEGLHPRAVQISKQIWCAPDRNKAWDDYTTKDIVPKNDGQCANPVDETIALGARLKISGTPTLIFADGQRIPGMVHAAQLERLLAEHAK
ncbi:MAG: thiol:disulfide interchange protein [Hydrogenophilales bacterium 16-62-9]|nr:MAG: thiol:disulfide interchange protein [Hydrogenophilales bacterium 16-62-9]